MSEWDQKQEGARRQSQDQNGEQGFHRVLDAALATYASIEPRAGLEGKVLANLRAERQPVPVPGFWRWSAAVGVAVVLIVVVALTWKSGRPGRNTTPQRPMAASTVHQSPQGSTITQGNGLSPSAPSHRSAAWSAHRPVVIASAVVATQPKLDQFPSPQPLSDQERMLASYVAQYPETAALVAQARAEALQKEMEEEAHTNPADSIR